MEFAGTDIIVKEMDIVEGDWTERTGGKPEPYQN